ncbi:hypothetical protein Pint_32436 [Pistacia integerrima]|uniref:Uncharacterized protein n=1 Tax=Pistacia integerrima TaxID=434235 RepID=A0ACC0XNR1_9ROSI|nr:hypothetical protein Pint_32436 [Pistacia integerrima]
MGKLKIAEGGNDPYLDSTNNFVGRQTWEFDPEAGTPEGSELRLKLLVKISTKTGFGSRPVPIFSGGCRERNFKQTIPAVKVEDGEEITYETATTSLRRAVHFFSALQASDGHWPAEIAGPLYCLQPLVMCTYITGHLNSVFPAEYRKEILRYTYYHQNEDGGWGFHIEGHSIMFCTVLSYVCMRILGEGPDGGEDNACARARKWILDRGGATHIPSWGKTWLSIFGVYEWSGTNPMPPEFWILPSFLPVHPKKALQVTMEHIHYEDENSRYITMGCVEKVLCMLACWVKDPNGDYFKKHVARIPDYLWVAEDGMKMQTFGSQEWDTSLAIQALLASDLADEIGPVLKRGHEFIKASHVMDNPSGDFKGMYRHISKGSWTFSDQDHRWQVSDCTAEEATIVDEDSEATTQQYSA